MQAAADSVILRGKSERENIISFAKDSLMCVKGSNQSTRAHHRGTNAKAGLRVTIQLNWLPLRGEEVCVVCSGF